MCFKRDKLSPRKQSARNRRLENCLPRLSRKVVPNARVNLNSYWSKFEDVTALVEVPTSLLVICNLTPFDDKIKLATMLSNSNQSSLTDT